MQQELLLLNIREINYVNLNCNIVQQGLKKKNKKPCQAPWLEFLIQTVFRKT